MGLFDGFTSTVDEADEVIDSLKRWIHSQVTLIKTSHDPDVTDDVSSDPLEQCINLLATANNIDVLADVFHDYNLDVEEFQKDLYGAHEILAGQDEANVDKPRRAARERLDRCLNKLQSAS